jgi:hypothetical protein
MKQDLYDLLFNNDQLYMEMQLGHIPKILQEGKIEFAPTFKRRPKINTEFGLKRLPSWTDRILFGFNKESCKMMQKSYDSNNLVSLSDHRPVFS